ncbi:hypothetical protein [Streptomyces scopuliridis]
MRKIPDEVMSFPSGAISISDVVLADMDLGDDFATRVSLPGMNRFPA